MTSRNQNKRPQPFVQTESPDDMPYEGMSKQEAQADAAQKPSRIVNSNVAVDSPDDVEA